MAEDSITGEEIVAARQRAGLTQAQLAALVGVAPRSIGNWERGEAPPTKNVARLRDVLGLAGNSHGGSTGQGAGEPTLHAASDAQLVAEIAYRLSRTSPPAV